MPTFLFPDVLIGPIRSRRFGNSLGINLLPTQTKFCNFDCVYCECGWSDSAKLHSFELPNRELVKKRLEKKLQQVNEQKEIIDSITFAGNGEPTIHPDFANIVEDTLDLRNKYIPNANVTVLTNATSVHKEKVFKALLKTDLPILKLDAGSEKMFQRIDQPAGKITLEKLTERLQKFNGNCVIQTLFLRGTHQNQMLDNTAKEEVQLWIQRLQKIKPQLVMIYSVDRDAPINSLEKISANELEQIAQEVKKAGLTAKVYV